MLAEEVRQAALRRQLSRTDATTDRRPAPVPARVATRPQAPRPGPYHHPASKRHPVLARATTRAPAAWDGRTGVLAEEVRQAALRR
ncbi:hypothetical protein AB0B40_02870, partial [Streptomyces sp. NPDC042638]